MLEASAPLRGRYGCEVSVIILTINGRSRLPACLNGLAANDVDMQVVLVDNGSTDDSIEVATHLRADITALRNATNTGFAAACNQGARAGRGRYLLFLNDDAVVAPSTIRDLLRFAADDQRGAAWQPPLVSADGLRWDSAGSMFTPSGVLWHEPAGQPFDASPRASTRVFATKGACMLVRTSSFWEVGGFDESFFAYFEETDLCWRLALRNYVCRFVSTAPVRHVGGATSGRLFSAGELDLMFFRNRLTSVVTLPAGATLAKVLPLHTLMIVSLAAIALITGRPERARGILRACAHSVTHWKSLRARRRAEQAARLVGDRAVFADVVVKPRARDLASAGLSYLKNRE